MCFSRAAWAERFLSRLARHERNWSEQRFASHAARTLHSSVCGLCVARVWRVCVCGACGWPVRDARERHESDTCQSVTVRLRSSHYERACCWGGGRVAVWDRRACDATLLSATGLASARGSEGTRVQWYRERAANCKPIVYCVNE